MPRLALGALLAAATLAAYADAAGDARGPLVHAAAGLVLFGLLARLLARPPLAGAHGRAAPLVAFGAAALWLAHPLQAASVTGAAAPAGPLGALAYLGVLYGLVRCADGGSRAWCAASVLACALGMSCAPVLASAPVCAVLLDRVLLADSWRSVLRRRGWLYLGLVATLPLRWYGGFLPRALGLPAGHDAPGLIAAAIELASEGHRLLPYLRGALWPAPRLLDAGTALATAGGTPVLERATLAALLVASLVALARRRWIGLVGAFFLLVPWLAAHPAPAVGDALAQRAYLASAALAVALVALARRAERWLRGDAAAGADGRPVALACALFAVPLLLATHARARAGAEAPSRAPAPPAAESVALAETMVRTDPSSADAHYELGRALQEAGRLQEAARAYEAALRLAPAHARAQGNLGCVLLREGDAERALEHLHSALAADPTLYEVHFNTGFALQTLGDLEGALRSYATAIRLRPDACDAYTMQASCLLELGRVAEAEEVLRAGLRRAPPDPAGDGTFGLRLTLGNALRQAGRPEAALAEYERARELRPTHPLTWYNIGLVCRELGREADALAALERARALAPDRLDAVLPTDR